MKTILKIILVACIANLITGLEVVWILDGSASIGRENFRYIKNLVRRTSQQVETRKNTTFDILEFGSRVKVYTSETSEEFYSTLESIGPNLAGSSKTSNAFRAVYNQVFYNTSSPDNGRVIVLVSDGVPKPGPEFGGPVLVNEVQTAVNRSGIDKLIFVNVRNTVGQASSNPKLLNKVGAPYNNETDLMKLNFNRAVSGETVNELVDKIVNLPTLAPTENPTASPTESPTAEPTEKPTENPTVEPTNNPTEKPTEKPTFKPTFKPTNKPSFKPTENPTLMPSTNPTNTTSESPTNYPTPKPTKAHHCHCEEPSNFGYILAIIILGLMNVFFMSLAFIRG